MFLKKLAAILFISLLSTNLYGKSEPTHIDEICTQKYYECTDECDKLSQVSQNVVYQCIYRCEDLYEKCINKEFKKEEEN